MRNRRTHKVAAWAAAVVVLGSGCGMVRETIPARSAMEQLLISTAADRAVDCLPAGIFTGKRVVLDTANLECLDKAYVVERLRGELLSAGAILVKAGEAADIHLEVASGALSIDKRDMLFGIPAIPLPIPYAGETLKFPEIPFWKLISYNSRAKLLLAALDPAVGTQTVDLPLQYGQARDSYIWVLMVGPFRRTNLPKEAR